MWLTGGLFFLTPFLAGRTASAALRFLHFGDTGCVQVMYILSCVYARKSNIGKVRIALEQKVGFGSCGIRSAQHTEMER